jgi:hypothetical protein
MKSKTLVKIADNFTVNMYDNGYMVEASGYDESQEYVRAKYVCKTDEELLNYIKALIMMEREE